MSKQKTEKNKSRDTGQKTKKSSDKVKSTGQEGVLNDNKGWNGV
ncbi:MAG: hypothetical protein PHC92_06465 [Syntrophomonadaceae bacterium]|nr:hypothetical protein [Syntrophomonadaceae bacterium]MDD3022644.1 hypothetical protein [Syntrophomonadaceae bacterium]